MSISVLQNDQAEGLRRLLTQDQARIISIYGAKDRSGHSQITLNLAQALSEIHERKVLILDQSEPHSQLVNLLNIETSLSNQQLIQPELLHVLLKSIQFEEALVKLPEKNMIILPCEKAIQLIHKISEREKLALMQEFNQLKSKVDTVFIHADDHNLDITHYSFTLLTQENIIILTADYQSIKELYALIRKIHDHLNCYVSDCQKIYKRFHVLINKVNDESHALDVFNRVYAVAQEYLNIRLDYLGFIPFDPKLQEVSEQHNMLNLKAISPSVTAIREIADKILDFPYSGENSKLDILIHKTLSTYQNNSFA